MNLAQLRLEVRRALDGVDDDFWSDGEINDWLNEAVWTMCAIAQPLQQLYQDNTVAGQQEYPVPFEVEEVFGVSLVRSGASLDQLEKTDPRLVQIGALKQGTPTRFYIRTVATQTTNHGASGITVGQVVNGQPNEGRMVLGFDPVPVSVMQFNVSFFSRHFRMIADGDVPLIAPEYQRGLICYATALGKEKEGFDDEGSVQRAKFAEYSEKLRTKMISRGFAAGFPSVIVPDAFDEPFGYTKIYP